jgi:DNA repair photolyase
MIQETKGMFLSLPFPYQITMNVCSHYCHYCFANLNKPDRCYDEKKTIAQIVNSKKSKTLIGEFMRRGYPVLASNLVDVFAKNNYKHFLEAYELLRKFNIPIAFQTRGGNGVDEVLKTLPPSYWYISITSHDDNLAKPIEPNSPSVTERIELVKKLHSLGHKIEIGVNPYMRSICDIEKLLQLTRPYTDMYWINSLHINPLQKKRLTAKGINALEPEMNKTGDQLWEELLECFEIMVEYGVIPSGFPHYSLVDRSILFSVYENKLPTINDFLIEITKEKKPGDTITKEDFIRVMTAKYPSWLKKFDSGYIVSVKRNKETYKGLHPSYTLEEILSFHWDNMLIAESSPLTRSLCFQSEEDNLVYLAKPFIHPIKN